MKKWKMLLGLIFMSALSPLSANDDYSGKIILVLGSGGSKGLSHVGVIEELEKMGIKPDLIVGCSSGAIVGALYAQHKDIAYVKKILIDLKSDDLVDFSLFQKQAVSTRKKLQKFLKKHLDANDFSSLEIPFVAVATDLQQGKPVYFEEGEIIPAVLASSALPGLFPPYIIEDRIYVDGGITDPLPVGYARKLGENAIIIASDISPSLDGFQVEDIVQVIRKSFEVLYQRIAFFERGEADILLEMNFEEDPSPIQDGVNKKLYEHGKQVVRDCSEQIMELIPGCSSPSTR